MTRTHASVLSLALFALAASAGAGVTELRVQVDGMACPFCAYNIEKRLKTLAGVEHDAELNVSVERGLAVLPWTEAVAFDPDAVREQVRRAGFTPGGIQITTDGVIRGTDDARRLELADAASGGTVVIEPGERADRKQTFNALRRAALASASQPPFHARISGAVKGGGSTWRLVLQRWEPLRYGEALVLGIHELVCENCVWNVVEKMEALADVLHAEADFESDRLWVWTESRDPDLVAIGKAIESAGFSVTQTNRSAGPPQE